MKMSKMICNNNNDKKAEGDEGKEMVRKGPWTRAEDEMLREYVRNHGDRNWSSVVKKTGLTRSGKSCRLRWTNHLRPDLKKTAFCKQEERIIVYLHSQIGNKWARMAAQLPGRTDNEIKNFWNTRIKRCQREGLPIYPQPQELETFKLLLQQNQFSAQAHPSSSSLPFSSSLYPSHYHQEQPRFEVPNENCGNGDKVVLPLSPAVVSIYGSSSSSENNNNDSHDYHFGSYNYGFNNNVEMVGDKSLPLVQCMNAGVSSQSPPPPHGSINSANNSSYASEVHGCVGASSSSMANNNNGYHEVAPLSPHGNNNGLLNDIIMAEAQNLFLNDNIESEDSTRAEELSKVSTGKKVAAENTIIMEGMNLMDDDLFGVLNNFCFEMPVPEWYHKGGTNQPLGSD